MSDSDGSTAMKSDGMLKGGTVALTVSCSESLTHCTGAGELTEDS